MREMDFTVYGANITGGEGGANGTSVAVDAVNTLNYWFHMGEVDMQGAVVFIPNKGYQRMVLANLNNWGVQVSDEANNNPILRPGAKRDFQVGSHKITIEGTGSDKVMFNNHEVVFVAGVKAERYPNKE